MGIAVLGPLTIDDSGALGRRDRIILEALVARAGRPVSSDQLADAVWGDRPPASAAKNIQGCIVRLRKLLGQDAIVTSSHGYRLDVAADEVDARRFERGVARSREMLLLGEHDRAAFQLTEALALWRGEPFGNLEGWAGAETEVRRLHELRLDAEELRIEAHLAGGRHREVLAEAQALVGAAPLRERRWALLAHAQYLTGRQGEALRTIHQLKAVLSEHLGIDPGPGRRGTGGGHPPPGRLARGHGHRPGASHLPVPGASRLRARRRRPLLRQGGGRRGLPPGAAPQLAARAGRPIRLGEVLTPARRAGGRAA